VIPTLKNRAAVVLATVLLSGLAAAQSYCECTPGLGPCGNDAGSLPGGCVNSTQAKGFLGPIGSTSVEYDDLLFSIFNLPSAAPTVLFMGSQAVQLPFGDGLLCVAGGAVGIAKFTPKFTTGLGTSVYGPGLAKYSQQNFLPAFWIHPGETWHFQLWYRDPEGPCGKGFNLTNAVAVGFTP
jgi:hypothetical protein